VRSNVVEAPTTGDTDNEVVVTVQKKKKVQSTKVETVEKKEIGRPAVEKENRVKPRVVYYTDDEFAVIEKIAKLYDMKPMKFIKMCVTKELKKENII